MDDTELRAVYVKPGATLDQYDEIALLDCYLAFKKHWQRDYNEDVAGMERRVDKKDMERIQKDLAAEFKKVFTEELETEGGYKSVDHAADNVLALRPAIVDLDATAPDTMSPGMSMTVVSSAGQMTLYLELFGSITNDIIARIIDPEASRGTSMAEVSSRGGSHPATLGRYPA